VKQVKAVAGVVNHETSIIGKDALYMIDVSGEKANAHIRIKTQKVGAGWKVLGFWVEILQSNPAVPSNGQS
jgi:hypothetical protein